MFRMSYSPTQALAICFMKPLLYQKSMIPTCTWRGLSQTCSEENVENTTSASKSWICCRHRHDRKPHETSSCGTLLSIKQSAKSRTLSKSNNYHLSLWKKTSKSHGISHTKKTTLIWNCSNSIRKRKKNIYPKTPDPSKMVILRTQNHPCVSYSFKLTRNHWFRVQPGILRVQVFHTAKPGGPGTTAGVNQLGAGNKASPRPVAEENMCWMDETKVDLIKTTIHLQQKLIWSITKKGLKSNEPQN